MCEVILAFFLGLMVGAGVGVFAAVLCSCASRSDSVMGR